MSAYRGLDPRPSRSVRQLTERQRTVFDTIVRKNVRLAEAPSFGLPIVSYDPRCHGAEDYRCLAREVLETDLVKLEVLGDKKTLLPDPVATLEATETLVKEGFTVLTYTSDDPVMAKRLDDLTKMGKGARYLVDPAYNPAVKFGFKSGTMIEGHARLSHYLWRRSQGMSADEAAGSVMKYLFDYKHGLTPLEKKLFRDLWKQTGGHP